MAAVSGLPPFVAMTTSVGGWIPAEAAPEPCGRAVRRVFARVERRLTRFRPGSELNRFCVSGAGFGSPLLFRALTTASRAWLRSGGLFDPRIRRALEALGYDGRLRFGAAPPRVPRRRPAGRFPAGRSPWLAVAWTRAGVPAPGGRRPHGLRLTPPVPLDLGGIGKGLAVRYGAAALRRRLGLPPRAGARFGCCRGDARAVPGFLLDAGGDIWAEGAGPGAGGWTVDVQGPGGGPVARLRVAGAAVCTSSRGRRAWTAGGRPAHHLIDPRTGRPADAGLWAVTVVGRDPAWAEVWSKALFVAGAAAAPALAERRGLAALMVDAEGAVAVTRAARPFLDGPAAAGGDGP